MQLLLALALVLALGCAPSAPTPEDAAPLTVILGAKLIDGTAADPIEDSVVVIEGNQILAAGPRSSTPTPDGAETIDGAGKTIIPGLVELHSHYHGDPAEVRRQFGAQLAFGVTTSRSIGTDPDENLAAIEEVRAGQIPGPRMFTAGRGFTHPEGHPITQTVVRRPATPDEARQDVRELAAQEVDFVKMWVDSKYEALPKISREVREAVVDEAGKRNIPAVAHIFDLDDLEHLIGIGVTDFLHAVRDVEPLPTDVVELCKSRGVSFATTLTVIESNWLFPEDPRLLEDDPEALAALSPDMVANLRDQAWRDQKLASSPIDILKPELEQSKRFFKQMHDAGIALTLGSDSGSGTIPTGWGSHNELRLLVESGIPPVDVLRIATGSSAKRLGSKGADFGILKPGKIADLVLLDADPTQDIRNSRKISRVMRAGQWVDRSVLGR